MGKVFVEIGADPSKFFAAVGKLNKSIGKIGSSMQSFGTKMTALGGAVVAPMFASAMAFANVGSALNDMSKRTGVATEALSVLQFAAEQTGTDMGSVEGAVKKMQKAIFAASDGSKEAADALAMVGLSASDLAGLSADEQMGKIADGLMAIQDPGVRAAVAMQIFGKSGTAILPMLEGGAAGMAAFADEAKRLGLVMDSETAAKADALGDAVDSLKASMKMAFIQVGSAIAPILTQLARGLAVISANVGAFIRDNEDMVVAVLKGASALAVVGGAIYGLGYSLKTVSGAVGLVLKGFGLFSALASPVLLVAAGIVAAGVAIYQFKDKIAAALGPVGGLVQLAADSIGTGFGGAVSSAVAVLSDLGATASTTFNGIYEAIAAGDLSGAMDVLWAGLYAGWLRGVEALMGAVDPWVSMFQNTFTILGTEIAKTWDGLWTWVSNGFNTFGAYLQGAFDNVINGVLGAFDGMVAAVRKSWNWVQSFIRRGYDLAKENEKVDNEMEARRREREAARPGIEGRTRKAAEQNAAATRDSKKRQEAMDAEAQATIDGREAENRRRADQRRADTQAAESNLANVTSGKREQRARNDQFAQLLKDVENATSVDALTDLQGEFEALHASGRLNSGQTEALTAAFDAAYGRVADAAEQAAGNDAGQKIEDGAKMAAEPRTQAEVAGTFSSMALGGMGFGSSLAQKQLDMLGKIESNTRPGDEGLVAA
jgi:hypothetical protein